jgi:hypothetical protein
LLNVLPTVLIKILLSQALRLLILCFGGKEGDKMKKLMITVLVSTFVFGLTGFAHAALYSEIYSPTTATSLNKNWSANYVFNLGAAGNIATIYNANGNTSSTLSPTLDNTLFSPAPITSATLSLGLTIQNNATYSIKLYDINQSGTASTAFYTSNNYTGPIDLSGFSSYLADGKILAKISNTASASNQKVNLNNVSLQVQTVPLPGAAWLLGAGLIGLIGARRKQLA